MTFFIRRNMQTGRFIGNGRIAHFLAADAAVPRNTFVEIVTVGSVQKVIPSVDKIDGITQTACSAGAAGLVWIL